ncbi:MAG: WecB/TagA/CpsF family glycosyltransferase [Pseudonocardia sp.]
MTTFDRPDVPTLLRTPVDELVPVPRSAPDADAARRAELRAPATFGCCGVRIAALHPDEAVAALRARAQLRRPTGVHLVNAFTLKLATGAPAYTAVLNTGSLNLPDGTPVAWAARRAGHANVTEPVRGPGLLDAVLTDGLSWGARHYFYGSTPEVIDRLRESLRERHPALVVAGMESPPFRPLTAEERVATHDRLVASRPHYVWVGLGTPKQDWFVSEFSPDIPAVTLAIGAAFDFAAGTLPEAPAILHGSGFEWLYRLATEPRRLAGRYLRTATVIPQILRSGSGSTPRPPAGVAATADGSPSSLQSR